MFIIIHHHHHHHQCNLGHLRHLKSNVTIRVSLVMVWDIEIVVWLSWYHTLYQPDISHWAEDSRATIEKSARLGVWYQNGYIGNFSICLCTRNCIFIHACCGKCPQWQRSSELPLISIRFGGHIGINISFLGLNSNT